MVAMYRLTGIVLNRRNVGPVDRAVTVLAADGKHVLRARGTQKLASKLAGSLEPLTLVELTVAPGRRQLVTGSTVRDSYRNIHANLARISGASLLVSAVDALVFGLVDDTTVFRRVREALALLSRSRTNRDVFLAVAYGLWNLLWLLGHADRPTSASAGGRLQSVLLRGRVNQVRRIRCRVATARWSVEAAVVGVEQVAERPVPAAAFFRAALGPR
ncbi:MAG: recombination protein O N-terminal domain-containing protein [Candidatus Kerfeldbacteria bacterium]|nr:recombination protein O N-terminal domain-containing protein [Candidatus Kerfeldbacteria bacterium]